MRNERIFVKHGVAENRAAGREILLKGTEATLLTAPLYPRTGNVSFVVGGKRYEMPFEDFMDTTTDLHLAEPILSYFEQGPAATSAA